MTKPCLEIDPEALTLDPKHAAARGESLRDQYEAADPFPHVVIDNFLPESLAQECLERFPDLEKSESFYESEPEFRKASYSPDTLHPRLRDVFHLANSAPFLRFLGELTGIEGLISDPYFRGGGLHETIRGGRLDVHADFNFHSIMRVERRINVLIYLNRDWNPEWAGQLELWDSEAKNKIKAIDPVFNRCVIFNTTSDSMHGHPEPLKTPEGVSRRSMALYYYTSTWDETKNAHKTKYPRHNRNSIRSLAKRGVLSMKKKLGKTK